MKRRLIQVGVGGWGATWLEKVLGSPSWELVACVDTNESVLEEAKSTHQIPSDRCFGSLAEATRHVEADAALIVVPPEWHLPAAVEAFRAGLHVLVEKPLADTMANAHEMVRQAEASGKVLMVSQNYRYRRAPQTVARLLEEGWLGKVNSATIEFRKAPHFVLPDVPHGYSHYKLVEDMSIHHFDQMRGILKEEPTAVYAQTRNPEWSWFAAPPIVSAVIELESGGLVHYYGSWVSRGRQTTWDGAWFIDCEKGQIEWAENRVRVRPEEIYYTVHLEGFLERGGWMEAELLSDFAEDRAFTLEELGRCIEAGREPETSGRDNLRSVALTYAVVDSARLGERRQIADYLSLAPSSSQTPG